MMSFKELEGRYEAGLKQVLLDGRRLEYYHLESGTGKPVLLLIHGLADRAQHFLHLFPLLTKQFEVLAVSLPGHGESDPLPEMSPEDHAETVLMLLRRLHLAHVHVVGNSMGGMVGAYLAAKDPHFVRSLLLYGTPLYLPLPHWLMRAVSKPVPMLRHLFSEEMIADMLANGACHTKVCSTYLKQALGKVRLDTVRSELLSMSNLSLLPILKQVDAEVTYMMGTHDSLLRVFAKGRKELEELPHVRLDIIKKAGHVIDIDQPGPFIASLLRHCS